MSVSCDEQPHTTLGGLEEDRRGLLTFANLPKVERMELSSTGQRTGLQEGRTRVLSKAILKKKKAQSTRGNIELGVYYMPQEIMLLN